MNAHLATSHHVPFYYPKADCGKCLSSKVSKLRRLRNIALDDIDGVINMQKRYMLTLFKSAFFFLQSLPSENALYGEDVQSFTFLFTYMLLKKDNSFFKTQARSIVIFNDVLNKLNDTAIRFVSLKYFNLRPFE